MKEISFRNRTEGADFHWSAEKSDYACSGTFVREVDGGTVVSLSLQVRTKEDGQYRGSAAIYGDGKVKYSVSDVVGEKEANAVIAAAAACIADLSEAEIVTE